jgi:hypothetical protein
MRTRQVHTPMHAALWHASCTVQVILGACVLAYDPSTKTINNTFIRGPHRVDAPALVPVSAGAAPVSSSEQDLMRRLIAGMMLILTLGERTRCRMHHSWYAVTSCSSVWTYAVATPTAALPRHALLVRVDHSCHEQAMCTAAGYATGSGPYQTDVRTDLLLAASFGWQNAVLFSQMLANAVSVTAAAALMYPAMESANGVPLWPWLPPAYFTGILPLLAYITAWQPKPRMRLPPTSSQMVSISTACEHLHVHALPPCCSKTEVDTGKHFCMQHVYNSSRVAPKSKPMHHQFITPYPAHTSSVRYQCLTKSSPS